MSKHFVEMKLYGNDGENFKTNEWTKDEILNPTSPVVLAVPSWDTKDTYNKVLLECTCNELKDVAEIVSLTLKPGGNLVTVDGLHENSVLLVRRLASTLQYLINCQAWGSTEMLDHDYYKIVEELNIASNLLAAWRTKTAEYRLIMEEPRR